MANKKDGQRTLYIKPEITKLGNVMNVTFSSPEWNCSVCGSDDTSSDDHGGHGGHGGH